MANKFAHVFDNIRTPLFEKIENIQTTDLMRFKNTKIYFLLSKLEIRFSTLKLAIKMNDKHFIFGTLSKIAVRKQSS
jgi:hypothetical protein